jgi:hypothetical protein
MKKRIKFNITDKVQDLLEIKDFQEAKEYLYDYTQYIMAEGKHLYKYSFTYNMAITLSMIVSYISMAQTIDTFTKDRFNTFWFNVYYELRKEKENEKEQEDKKDILQVAIDDLVNLIISSDKLNENEVMDKAYLVRDIAEIKIRIAKSFANKDLSLSQRLTEMGVI